MAYCLVTETYVNKLPGVELAKVSREYRYIIHYNTQHHTTKNAAK